MRREASLCSNARPASFTEFHSSLGCPPPAAAAPCQSSCGTSPAAEEFDSRAIAAGTSSRRCWPSAL